MNKKKKQDAEDHLFPIVIKMDSFEEVLKDVEKLLRTQVSNLREVKETRKTMQAKFAGFQNVVTLAKCMQKPPELLLKSAEKIVWKQEELEGRLNEIEIMLDQQQLNNNLQQGEDPEIEKAMAQSTTATVEPEPEAELSAMQTQAIHALQKVAINAFPSHGSAFIDRLNEHLKPQVGPITDKDELAVFTERWTQAIKAVSSMANEQQKYGTELLLNVDYHAIHQQADNQRTILLKEQVLDFYQTAMQHLREACPCRDKVTSEILQLFIRRLLQDNTATFPVLHGPPGAGKTHLARCFTEAARQAGIPIGTVVQNMILPGDVSRNKSDEIEMKLLGTDIHYSNGSTGLIYNSLVNPAKQARVLVVLDEADKSPSLKNFMINLLDPDQPLQDNFLATLFPEHNLRDRVLFMLTVNEIEQLLPGKNDPLSSRLTHVYFQPYSRQEMVNVITKIGQRQLGNIHPYDEREFQDLANRAITALGTDCSFRRILDMVGRLAFAKTFPDISQFPDRAAADDGQQAIQYHRKPRLGFALQ